MSATERDQKTSRQTSGVRLNDPTHWATRTVHSFHHWRGETEVMTWCALTGNLADGARLTTDLVSCLGCGQASLLAVRE